MTEFNIDDIICLKKDPHAIWQVIDKNCEGFKNFRYVILHLLTKGVQYLNQNETKYWNPVCTGKITINNIMKF